MTTEKDDFTNFFANIEHCSPYSARNFANWQCFTYPSTFENAKLGDFLPTNSMLSGIYIGDFFATRFEDFLCVKISLAEWLLTRDETRLPPSRLARIAAM